MDLDLVIAWGSDFFDNYPTFCYVAGGVLLALTLWKPVKALKTILLVVVLLAGLYVAFLLIDSLQIGAKLKGQGIHKSEKVGE
jgi:hypothetical protein